ncbi:putative TATA element modulatory factor, partial [Operophtera brumata]
MSSPSAVVCREIFDENSQPSAEEVSEYAAQLGIDPDSESHLLPLARDGLMQALPSQWKAYYDEKLQTHYYYNEDTKKTQWEHPLDHVYRELVKKARDASMQDDTCASVQHLERVETKVESDEELSTDSENHQSDVKENASTLIGPRRLTPLGRPPLSPLARLDKKLGDIRISPLRRSADSPHSGKPLLRNSSDRELLSRQFERPKVLFKQQSEVIDLKMHLSKSDLPSPDTDKSQPLDSMTKSDPPKVLSPLASRPPLPPRFESPKESADSDSHQSRTSPRRRVLRPPPGDYIKPELFQKSFHKISDLISINLMESIESETSIDSPDKEFANLDLNDLDDMNDVNTHNTEPKDGDNSIQDESPKISIESKSSRHKEMSMDSKSSRMENVIPQIKVPTLDLKVISDSDSKSTEESTKPSKSIDSKSPQIKTSPITSEIRSPKLDFSKPWNPLSSFSSLNKAPMIRIESPKVSSPRLDGVTISSHRLDGSTISSPKLDGVSLSSHRLDGVTLSNPRLDGVSLSSPRSDGVTLSSPRLDGVTLSSPRLDGVTISQGKSSSDNVVVVYQFETQDESPKPIKSPLIPDMGRDMIERNKADERRRLEISLQKEIEGIKMEWSSKERRMRAELQEELKEVEEKFMNDKRVRLSEQSERHRREMEDLHAQLQETLGRERLKMMEANRATVDSLKEEHTARHLCHVSEVRTRLAHERAAVSNKIHDPHLVDKYRCLKEKYARLKHDVKMSLERRNKRREMSMTTGSETEKSNSHKGNQSLE